ncbi:hypothetical protein CR513_09032, partial [Mucuna pruriens]
ICEIIDFLNWCPTGLASTTFIRAEMLPSEPSRHQAWHMVLNQPMINRKKISATTVIGGSGTPIPSMGSSNAMFKSTVIIRVKRHQLGIREDVGACTKISEDIMLELKTAFKQKKAENKKNIHIYMEGVQEDANEKDEVEEIVRLKSGKRPTSSLVEVTLAVVKKKNVNVKYARARIIQHIEWNSIQCALIKVGNYGPHPNSTPYKELQYTKDMLKGQEEERRKYGYPIMSDG